MLSEREVSAAIGTTAYGTDGDKLGTIEHFFTDDRTGSPTWAAVTTGLFGTRHSVVPAVDASMVDGAVRLPVTAEAVKTAPDVPGDHLDPGEEELLRRHYGLAGRETAPDATQEIAVSPPAPAAAADRAPSPSTDADGAMTRSEERLRVGTERVAATRVRLVKYVVTEEVQITVPIRREEIRVEEVPLDAGDDGAQAEAVGTEGETLTPAADSGGPAGLPGELVLHTERPVVSVEVVPVERVRLRTETVEGQDTVSGQVQRERIVVEETPSPRRADAT
jgi:stress response protein YsnF